MKLTRWLQRPPKRPKSVVVTFTGGMGAQIISAAIYYHLRESGQEVYADLSYFDQAEHLAEIGNKGEISHWSWQLSPFGLGLDSFQSLKKYSQRDVELIEDGPKKSSLAMAALRNPSAQKLFALDRNVEDIVSPEIVQSYLCIHVRRGDYLNVASHLVSDNEFFEIASKFQGIARNLVIVSDSPIEPLFRQTISAGYDQAIFLDNIDAFTTHRVMRGARILVCSNSQFSLIAALLNSKALVILPKQWFGKGNESLEAPIHALCSFQILS
jgi:hypothetical protein